MTILATHLSVVLGAWRLRLRIDIDEPRDDAPEEGPAPRDAPRHAAGGASLEGAGYVPWGRG